MNYFKSWHPQGNGSRPLAHDQVQDDTCGVVHQFLRSDKAQSVAREICPISHSVFLSWTPRSKSPHRKSLVKFTHLSCCIFFDLLVLVDVEASHFWMRFLLWMKACVYMSLKTYRFHDRSCNWICIHCTPRFNFLAYIDKFKRNKFCRGMHRGEICKLNKEKTRESRVPFTIVRTTLIKQCTQCPVEPFRKTRWGGHMFECHLNCDDIEQHVAKFLTFIWQNFLWTAISHDYLVKEELYHTLANLGQQGSELDPFREVVCSRHINLWSDDRFEWSERAPTDPFLLQQRAPR